MPPPDGYPPPPTLPASAYPSYGSPATTLAAGEGDAQQKIDREARRILRGYPVAVGLTGVADVVSHLSPLALAPPSYFPPPHSTSLQPETAGLVPSEPLFDNYSREIALLLGGTSADPAEEAWRRQELARVAGGREVRQQLGEIQGRMEYGNLPPLQPPLPYNTPSSLSLPSSSTASSLSHQFLAASNFPFPPLPTTFANPSVAPHLSSTEDPLKFFDGYVAEQLTRSAPRPQPQPQPNSQPPVLQTPPLPNGRIYSHAHSHSQHRVDAPPTSSPDPLMMGANGHFSTFGHPAPGSMHVQAQAGPGPRSIATTFNGVRYTSNGAPTHELRRKRSSSSNLAGHLNPFGAPLLDFSSADGNGLTHTPSSQLGAPLANEAGVESAVKRFKLDSGRTGPPGTGTSAGSGRGKVVGGDKKDVVERLSDLLSDLFSADDSHILDTSSAALGSSATNPQLRSPSRSAAVNNPAPSFFRTTAVSPVDSSPLLGTSTLRRLLKLLQSVGSKGKSEELLEDIEDVGMGRALKVLERSWEGIADQGGEEYWEREAAMARDEDEAEIAPKGEGKGKAPRGRSTSYTPAKKAGGGKKKQPVAEEDEGDDDVYIPRSSSPGKPGLRRSSRSPSRSRSPTLQEVNENGDNVARDDDDNVTSPAYWTADKLTSMNRAIRNLSDALLAIRTALTVLTLPSVSLPKHLFSSEYLLSLLSTLRHVLDAFILPLLEAPHTSPLGTLFVDPAQSETREKIAEVCDSFGAATDLVTALVKQEELSDELVISAVYFALSPFFHASPLPAPSGGKRRSSMTAGDKGMLQQAMKGIRMSSLGLVGSVYARYAEQRAWIVEEVLGNLGKGEVSAGGARKGKGAIRLRNNASIQTVSALLLHLVQTCPADLQGQVRKKLVGQAKPVKDEGGDVEMSQSMLEMRADNGQGDEDEDEDEGDVLGSVSRRLLEPAFESASKSARTIASFLLQRSCKAGKTASGTADSEYRAVLDHLIGDLLSALRMPEWPGAELLLGVFCRSMMATLADPKSTHETNALKGIALDHLGTIAARVCRDLGQRGKEQLRSLREIIAEADVEALEKLFIAQQSIVEHLKRMEASSGLGEGAAEFTRLLFARDVQQARESAAALAANYSREQLETSQEGQTLVAVIGKLDVLARELWERDNVEDVFGPSPEHAQPRIDALTLELSRSQPLANLYEPLLERIISASETSQVTFRTKALRGISLIVAQDPELFHQTNVRQSIENRMLDSSPAVRDAAIELVGKYVVGRPDLAVQYLPKLSERISDTGLSVRRRVVKLLKALYGIVDDEALRIDICRRLVYRVLDEDDGIKELAVDAIEDLWFSSAPKGAASAANQDQAARLASLSNIVMQVAGMFKERPPPVDEALRMIMAKHAEKGTKAPLERLREVMESLIDGLVEDDRPTNVVACVKTVAVLSAVDPTLLSTAKATMLLPFLKSASTSDEQAISDYLLKIFRGAVLAMPKTASKFGRDLQAALLPMLNRPSHLLQTMQEVVACFAAVVRGQTQDFDTMIKVFSVSMNRLANETKQLLNPATAPKVNVRQLPTLCYLTSLLCEHGDFDSIRVEYPAKKPLIDRITPISVAELVYQALVKLQGLPLPPAVRSAILTSLSFVYRAHPTFMLHSDSTDIIDAIFAAPNAQMHLQVLRIVQDFLASQERLAAGAAPGGVKKKKAEQGVKMDELVGDVQGFADSGVASAIAQRYLKRIIESSLSLTPALQRLGVDLLSMIARSGFSHPISLSPTLVALTASADSQIASKAYSTLSILHQKHASLLATRFLEPAKAAHAYVTSVEGGAATRGYRGDPPESHFGRWFSLLHKEKRQIQLDYLKTLARSFELEPGAKCSENDVSFARFVAEALSSLDFKRTEEPMLVISFLNAILAVSGLQVLHMIQQALPGSGGLLSGMSHGGDSISGSPNRGVSPAKGAMDADGEDAGKAPTPDLVRQSIICGLALLLRDHLKQLYSVTDAKMAKYVVGKKSAVGDKSATRHTEAPLALGLDGYERMPYALMPLAREADLILQRSTYITMVSEDGTIQSLAELEAEEDDDA
ncbi:hypothetical protein JCM21900_004761 [Sporobolomyces salmonicolor]